jgi:hypothetical protein
VGNCCQEEREVTTLRKGQTYFLRSLALTFDIEHPIEGEDSIVRMPEAIIAPI